MVKDLTTKREEYSSLDYRIKDIDKYKKEEVKSSTSFIKDDVTHYYSVENGEVLFATSWRESKTNDEVTATMKVGEGNFVLYLPGEKFALKLEEGARVTLRRLK